MPEKIEGKNQWQSIVETASAQSRNNRLRQQELYRLFESLKNKRRHEFDLAAKNTPLDIPLLLSGTDASPLAGNFKPENYKFNLITPMTWAACNDDVESLNWLIDAGADPSMPSVDGRDPLWMASIFNSANAWDWLLDHTTRWNARTVDGKRTTRLIDAVISSNVYAVKDLIMHGIDGKAVDNTGRNALHYNFLQNPYTDNDQTIGRMLVDYGVPSDAKDHEGVAPVALAENEAQQALMEKSLLMKVAAEELEYAKAQRLHLEATKPRLSPSEADPTEPGLPQITKPQKPKRFM